MLAHHMQSRRVVRCKLPAAERNLICITSKNYMQVEGMVLSTKDKRICACLTPREVLAEKENCCSSNACTVAEVQAMYQLPTGVNNTSSLLTPLPPQPAQGTPLCWLRPKGSLG